MTVKAFLSADLPIELIELLEKIVIEPSPFSDNRNLQNLLLLTAIRADKGKVVGYINKLQNYDVAEIAKIATDHGLYEEALTIYKKYDQHAMAINVLVEHIVSIDRGLDYANKVNKPEVWSRLAKAQLDGLRIKDAIGMPSEKNQGEGRLIVLYRLVYQGRGPVEFRRSYRDFEPRWQAR